jgi:hypothetical protein
MKKIYQQLIVVACIYLLPLYFVQAQTITSAGSGVWSNPATWVGGVVPGAANDVRIASGHVVTVDGNFACNSLQIGVAPVVNNTTLSINSGLTLTVAGAVTFLAPTANNRDVILDVADGNLVCASLTMNATGSDTRDCILLVNNGNATVSGNLATNSSSLRHHIDFSGNGTLNIAGNLSGNGGLFHNNFGTVNFNGSTAQTISASFNSYNHIRFTNSNIKSIGANTTVAGDLSIENTAQLDVTTSNYNLTVAGNWTVTSTHTNPFIERNGRVTFNGTSVQNISTVLSTGETFYNLTINNTSASNPALLTNRNINITNDYDHTAGFLDLQGNDLSATNSSNQTFDLTGGGVISSSAGSDFTLNSTAPNTIRVNFYDFQIGNATHNITINVTTQDSYFTNSIFYGPMLVTKIGTNNNDCDGGNIFYGPITFNTTPGGDRWRMGHVNGDIFYNLTVNHQGNGNFIFGRQATGNQYYGTTVLTSSTAGGIYIGRNNGNAGTYTHEFFGPLIVNVTSTGNINFADSDNTRIQNCIFHSTIQFNSDVTSTGDIAFGFSGNPATLTLTATAQFIPGTILGATRITLYSVTQNGTLTQQITTAGTSNILMGSNNVLDACTFNGPLTITTPTIDFRRNTFNNTANINAQSLLFQRNIFNGTTTINKTTGTTNNTTNGSNVFNAEVTFIHQGTGTWHLGAAIAGDDYNDNVTFLRMNTGTLNPAANNNSTFAGNISTVGTVNPVNIATVGGGRAVVDGNNDQYILGDIMNNPTFGNLTINKSGGDMILNVPLNITTDVTFVNRNIVSSATNLLIFNSGSGVTSPTNSSYVSGPVRKIGNTAFTFPVGKNNFYAPISINGGGSTTDHYTAEYFNIDPNGSYNVLLKDATLDHISRCEYWILDRTNGSTNKHVTLSWDSRSCGVTNLADLRIARWDGSQWKDHGNGSTTGTVLNGTVSTSVLVTSFSPFTLSSSTPANPLPIELLYFNAFYHDQKVDLTWATASEQNSHYFDIEKSKDGNHWEFVSRVYAAVNSSSINYYADIDNSPYNGTSYYRLKQVDMDGTFSYSNLAVVIVPASTTADINVFPNPTTAENINLELTGLEGKNVLVVMRDIAGREVYSKVIISTSGNYITAIDPEKKITAGTYFVIASSENILMSKKIIIK